MFDAQWILVLVIVLSNFLLSLAAPLDNVESGDVNAEGELNVSLKAISG